jgi:microcystin-dependent protein
MNVLPSFAVLVILTLFHWVPPAQARDLADGDQIKLQSERDTWLTYAHNDKLTKLTPEATQSEATVFTLEKSIDSRTFLLRANAVDHKGRDFTGYVQRKNISGYHGYIIAKGNTDRQSSQFRFNRTGPGSTQIFSDLDDFRWLVLDENSRFLGSNSAPGTNPANFTVEWLNPEKVPPLPYQAAEDIVADIRMFPYYVPKDYGPMQGQQLQAREYSSLYSQVGMTYGQVRYDIFALPEGRASLPLGAATADELGRYFVVRASAAPSAAQVGVIGINRSICVRGDFPSNYTGFTGEVRNFAGPHGPNGTLPCDGQAYKTSDYPALYAVIGNTYGDDNANGGPPTFRVPDLRGGFPVGAIGGDWHAYQYADTPDSLKTIGIGVATSYVIIADGMDPAAGGNAGAYLGELRWFAGITVPGGWVVADGRELSIASHPSLFSLTRDTFGGDGQSTFALPNLIGRTPSTPGVFEGRVINLGQVISYAMEDWGDPVVKAVNLTPILCLQGTFPPRP